MAKSYLSKEELLEVFYTLAGLDIISRGHKSSEWGLRENAKEVSFAAVKEGDRLIISLDGMHEKARLLFGKHDPDKVVVFWGLDEKWKVECTLILLTTGTSKYQPGPKIELVSPISIQ